MNIQAQAQAQAPTPVDQNQGHQRALRALQGGMTYLLDTDVVGPMKHSDGVTDLKWLLRKLMTGEWGIDMDPQRRQKELPPDPTVRPPSPKPPEAKSAKGNGGE